MGRPKNFDDSIFDDSLGSGSFLSGSGAMGSGSSSSGGLVSFNRNHNLPRRGEGLRVVSNGKGLSVTLTNAKDEGMVRAVIDEAAKQANLHDMHVDLHIAGEPDIGSGALNYAEDNFGEWCPESHRITRLRSVLDDIVADTPNYSITMKKPVHPFENWVKEPCFTIQPINEPPPPAAPIYHAPASPPRQRPDYSAIQNSDTSKRNSSKLVQVFVGLFVAAFCLVLCVLGIYGVVLPIYTIYKMF